MAGLSACAELVSRGVRVVLIEQRRDLGGRASSCRHRGSGQILDLGPHTVIESNRHFLQYLTRVNTRHLMEFSPTLHIPFVHLNKGVATFHCPGWRAPWGFLWGVMRYRLLGLHDRWAAVQMGRYLSSRDDDHLAEISIEEWLCQRKVSYDARVAFWDPLIYSVLNDHPSRLSLRSLGRIFRIGFLARDQRSGLGVPQVDWSRLVTGDLPEQIANSGGEIITGRRVHLLWIDGGRVKGVIFGDNHRLEADAVIAAVPISPATVMSILRT